MPKFAMSENMPEKMPRPTTSDQHEAESRTTAGSPVLRRVLDEATPTGRLSQPRVGVRRRTLLPATAVAALAILLTFAGQSLSPTGAAASVAAGKYADPCPSCRLSQGFKPGVHNGIDLAAPIGTPIYAAAAGTVTVAGPRDPAGFDQAVYINDDDGTVTWYGHIDSWLVHVGDHVSGGQKIATVGDRGNATGPHLHFEAHAPHPVDPIRWLRRHGVSI
jgi:murein DD-endopeptidase MepM/ murein hydrolase activator NlpD